jgi:hypothetical protein
VKGRQARLLAREQYTDALMRQVSYASPAQTAALREFSDRALGGTPGATIDPVEDEERVLSDKKAMAHELVQAVMLRSTSGQTMPFFLLCLSIAALHMGVPDKFWFMLSHVYILFSKQWTLTLCKAVNELLTVPPANTNKRTVCAVADNCEYHMKVTHQHINRDGWFRKTINWLTITVDGLKFPTPNVTRGGWCSPRFNRFTLRGLFDPARPRFAALRSAQWDGFFAQATAGQDILAHPQVAAPPTRTPFVVRKPVRDVGTAAYVDVDTALHVMCAARPEPSVPAVHATHARTHPWRVQLYRRQTSHLHSGASISHRRPQVPHAADDGDDGVADGRPADLLPPVLAEDIPPGRERVVHPSPRRGRPNEHASS